MSPLKIPVLNQLLPSSSRLWCRKQVCLWSVAQSPSLFITTYCGLQTERGSHIRAKIPNVSINLFSWQQGERNKKENCKNVEYHLQFSPGIWHAQVHLICSAKTTDAKDRGIKGLLRDTWKDHIKTYTIWITQLLCVALNLE